MSRGWTGRWRFEQKVGRDPRWRKIPVVAFEGIWEEAVTRCAEWGRKSMSGKSLKVRVISQPEESNA